MTATTMSDVDVRQAARFLDFMAEGEPVTFQSFDDGPEPKRGYLARILHGDLDQQADELANLNDSGAGIFWMVNFGDGKGRTTANVTGVRCAFLDLDGAPLQPVLAAGVEPHAVVESSPGKWHVYWQVTGCPLDKFKAVQLALAEKFGGDTSVKDLPRVMRVPGFLHRKGEPFQSRIESLEPLQPYPFEELVQRLGLTLKSEAKTKSPPPDIDPDTGEIRDQKIRPGGRHAHLVRVAGKLNSYGLVHAAILAAVQAENLEACDPPKTEAEVEVLVRDVLNRYREQHNQDPMVGMGGADEPEPDRLRVVGGVEFLKEFRIPDPLIDGLVPRGQLYGLTAPTGHGKTAVAALMQLCIANGLPFAGREVERGRVLVLAGENPDDYALRLLATLKALRLPPDAARDVLIVPGSFALGPATPKIEAQIEAIGPLACVFVDTSAAFFSGDDENSNVAMRLHASRLRALTELPGHPAVIALCHPTKNPAKDILLPRGGGAFLAEIDGNLTAWKDDKLVTMHWAGKLRGPGFEPLRFELAAQTLEVHDSKGRAVISVAAMPTTDDRAEDLAQAALSDENRVLIAMLRKPGATVADIALGAGFISGMNKPMKSKAHRVLSQLESQGLTKKTRAGSWTLTNKGREEALEASE